MAIEVPAGYTYLDWAATSPVCAEAIEAMQPYLIPQPEGGIPGLAFNMNANSLHAPGRAAFEALELARRSVARDLGCSRPSEIIFTSGATESDNAAVIGIAHAAAAERRRKGAKGPLRIITTAIEHEAVLEPVRRLAREGFDAVFLKPTRQGVVTPEALEGALTDDTVLVSIQAANGEVGAIQPIAELAALAHSRGALAHTDATQALGKIPFDLGELGIDSASFSAHKICGPKGVGALYLKARTPFEPQLLGGGQEDGRRSTTQNVCGIAGFAAACSRAVGMQKEEAAREQALRDRLYDALGKIDGVKATMEVATGSLAESDRFLPNIIHVLVDGYESETLVLRLDAAGFGVSGGSACSSHSLEPSHVLSALGIPADEAYGALRISIGHATTPDDIDRFAQALANCL